MRAAAVGGRRRLPAPTLPLLAVAIPLVFFGWVALNEPLSFDGGMNLQVARRLATHGEYARFYDELRFFPHEVQSNGPFLFVAAIWTGVLGTTQLGLQLANLVFVAAIAFVIWRMFRHWPGPAVVMPTVTLALLPLAFAVGVGGQGEIPALFFLLLCLGLLFDALQVEEDGRALALMSVAFVSVGLGVTTKTMILGGLPSVACAAAAVWTTRSLRARQVLVRVPLVAVPIVAFELFRMLQLGSAGGWWDWWSTQSGKVAFQSGLEGSSAGSKAATSPIDRIHILSEQLGIPAEHIVVWLAAVSVISVGLVLYLHRRRRDVTLARTVAIPSTVLSVAMLTYVAWWVLLLPERKVTQPVLGTRRILPALLAGNLALLLLIGGCVALLWRYRLDPDGITRRARVGLAVSAALLALVGVSLVVGRVPEKLRGLADADGEELAELQDAVGWMDRRPPGARFYGEGWWSAPVVSVMSDQDLHSTTTIDDWCSIDPDRDFVVWDRAARLIAGNGPTRLEGKATAELVADFGSARFFALTPTEKGCPDPEGG